MAARRDFIKTTVLGAAGLGLGATARAQGRVLGANDRVVLASIGIRGQGNSLKRGFARLKGVEIKTLCDVDENLFAERANDEKLKDVATFRPRYEKDMRRVFEDKDIDASSSPPRTTGTPSPRSGRCRRANTCSWRSPPPTPSGRAARWWRRPPSTRGSSRWGR